MKKLITICLVAVVAVSAANANWDTFIIRGDAVITDSVTAPDSTTGWTEFDVSTNGEKAGWGTDSANGDTIGNLESLSITRYVPATGDTTYAPYFNIWVSDGVGGYAVLANEPSHTSEYTAYGETAYDMTWDGALKNATTWVYEVSSSQGFKLPDGTTTYTSLGAGTPDPFNFNDFADYLIETPSTAYIAANFPTGSGAPRELGTNAAYGFNWIFGDTQSNYTGGHLAMNPTLVPEPTTIALLGLGGLLLRKRK